MKFEIKAQDGQARVGEIETAHGVIKTPCFMPVATRGVVRRLSFGELESLNNDIFLANTYHMALRPGSKIVRDFGGLHGFTSWQGPWITDSGGYQVFSLASLTKVEDAGVSFQSHIDGSKFFLGPKESMEIQTDLGADITMAFDQCVGADARVEEVTSATERTHRWALECLENRPPEPQNLYGIVQGGLDLDLREKSRNFLSELPFDGLAMGGLAVGEGHDKMLRVLEAIFLPENKPRYLMGVGWPRDIFAAIALGYDQFDCVLPSRNGRNGMAFVPDGRLNVKRKEMKTDERPLVEDCPCPTCSRYSRGFLHYLIHCGEVLGGALISLHNLHFYERMMEGAREAITQGRFESWSTTFLEKPYV